MRTPSIVLWKRSTFAIGLGWLLWGALFFDYPDWDVGLSLLMASFTYMTADWAVITMMQRRFTQWPLAIVSAWWCVDGSYWLYWTLVRPEVMIREGQWATSLCLYLLCGFIWQIDPAHVLRRLRPMTARIRATLQACLSSMRRP